MGLLKEHATRMQGSRAQRVKRAAREAEQFMQEHIRMSFATEHEWRKWLIKCARRRWSTCSACRLKGSRSRVVFGQGCSTPDLLICGEAPGAREDQTGFAFVGDAGKLMRRTCGIVGLDLRRAFITNACLCRPPRNRTPKQDETDACRARLVETIGNLTPKVILLMGATAARFIGSDRVARGEIDREEWPDDLVGNGLTSLRYVFGTHHPSYVLRQETRSKKRLALNRFASDLRRVANALREIERG